MTDQSQPKVKDLRIPLPFELHQQVKRLAVDENTTIKALVIDLLAIYVSLPVDKRQTLRRIIPKTSK